MNDQYFLEQLPNLYENWGQDSVYPKSAQFQAAIEQVNGMTTANVMQLLNFAVDCMEPGEIYCEIGCFQGATLIGALLNHSEQLAYAVDNFSRFDENGENLEKLIDNLTKFEIEEQVIFCEQDFEEFFWELREINFEEKIGVYFYDGAHDYRSQLMALLLVKPFLADRALIIVDDSNYEAVRQAICDFIASHPQCQMLLDLPTRGNGDRTFWNGLKILSWDVNHKTFSCVEVLRKSRQKTIIQSIYNLQIEHQHTLLELLRKEALELHEAEQYQAAEAKYKYFLRVKPTDFQIYYNLGILYYTTEQYQKAIDTLLKALEVDNNQAILHYGLGLVWEKLENQNQATASYQRAIDLDLTYVDTYNNLGKLLDQHGQIEAAEELYRKAIRYQPSHFGAYLNLANNLVYQNKIEAAIEEYKAALQLNSENNDIQINLDRLLSSHDNADQIYIKLGDYFFYGSKYETAIIQYEKSLEFHQGTVKIYLKLSQCFRRLRKLEEALSILERGINIDPASSDLYCLKILSLRDFGKFEEAKNLSELSCNLIPDNLSLQIIGNLLLPILYNSTEEIINCRKNFLKGLNSLVNNLVLDAPQSFKNALEGLTWQTNFYLHYQGLNDLEIQTQYGAFFHKIMAANYPQWSQPRSMQPLSNSGKIRVGYISTCMYNHVVGRLFLGWLKNANRNQFEIYCYSLTKRQDSVTQQFKMYSDTFYCLDDQIELVCETVIAARLHILVFLDLGMSPDIMQIASLRLAPVQCKAWGPPITSGLPTIDYFLSSNLMEPERAESHYSEQLVRLPNLGFSFAKPIIPELTKTRSSFQIPDEAIVYFSGQSLFKYLPQHDYIFVEIAKQVPFAKFIFISSQVSNGITQQFKHRLHQAFAKEGVNFDDFCLMLPRLSQRDYLNVLQLSDIFLDPLSWSGGATTLEAIACQLPIVTFPGEFLRGRHAYGILKMLGVTDTIANTEAEYIEIAVKLGLDTIWWHQISQLINERHDYLYDDRTCVRGLELFYQQVFRKTLQEETNN